MRGSRLGVLEVSGYIPNVTRRCIFFFPDMGSAWTGNGQRKESERARIRADEGAQERSGKNGTGVGAFVPSRVVTAI